MKIKSNKGAGTGRATPRCGRRGSCRRDQQLFVIRTLSGLGGFLFALALFAIPSAAMGQENAAIQVNSEIDRSTITIGDLVHYRVMVQHAPEVEVIWPSLGANLGAFEIRDYAVKPPREQNDLIFEETEYTISTFDTGRFIIPPIILEYALAGDSLRQKIQTAPLELNVRSLLPSEDTDILGLKPQAVLPRDMRLLLLYAAAGLLLIFLAALAVWYFKFRKKGRLPFARPEPPPRPAHEVALEALQALETEKLFEKGEVKAYYSRLSDILRAYIGRLYGCPALEMTTHELLQHLAAAANFNHQLAAAEAVLNVSDLAKFAKYESNADEGAATLQRVYAIVEATRPRPVPVEAAGEEAPATPRETGSTGEEKIEAVHEKTKEVASS